MLKTILIFLLPCLSLFSSQTHVSKINNIDIWYETFGQKKDPALLLIMGGCCQGVIWDKDFCNQLADEGFYVIRYDHRDSGLSTCFDFEKDPYDLMDMTKDAVGILDSEGIEKAHLFGLSLGGFIAKLMAGYFPERVHTILVMGSTCDIHPMNLAYAGLPQEEGSLLPPPSPAYLAWMQEFMKLTPHTDEEKLAQRLEGWNKLNGTKVALDEEKTREIHSEFLSRLRYPQGIVNHILALRLKQSENLIKTLPPRIKIPTVILQGSEDPIFLKEHGESLSQSIENSQYILVDGMGHVPNEHFYSLYIDILKQQKIR
jgi:pimeloyl-ACP methyl ester carboxylesterase